MSAPLVPPPANDSGANTCPRMLQRWLDINPVTKLDRVGSYITIPFFSIAANWNGYSTIVATYNFEGKNNFSLKYLIGAISNPNYLLAVSWIGKSGQGYRYCFWLGVGEKLPFQGVLYTGQLIGKNFRLEVWSTNNTPLVQTTTINIYTSVLGGFDYRYASDFTLVNNDGQQTNFSASVVPSVTTPPSTGLAQWFRADSGFTGGVSGTWLSLIGVVTLNCTGTATQSFTTGVINGQQYIDLSTGSFTGTIAIPVNFSAGGFAIVVLARKTADSGTNTVFQLLNDATSQYTLNVNNTTNKLNSNSLDMSSGLPVGQWVAAFSNQGIVIQSSLIPYEFQGLLSPSGTGSLACSTLTLPLTNTYIAEILIYNGSAPADLSTQLNYYFSQRYSGASMWNLPLVFPAGSVSQPNTIG